MDRDAEKPFVVDRTNSFPRDRAYPSSGPHDDVVERPRNGSLVDDRYLHRQGTTDFEIRRPNKRLRYTIPLRRRRKTLRDEEKGIDDEKGTENGYPTRPGLERETSRLPAVYGPHELYEIISTQFWVPDDEGQEVVTLTVKDDTAQAKPGTTRYESRWRHIQSEAMTFRQFHKEIMRLPGLEDEDLALAARLLNKVQKTCEKQYVHGRYLKPTVLVYDGADPDATSKEQKTATFISMPIFTTEFPRSHTSTKEYEGHPVRALLQSRYRLESTKGRDKEQVIRKIRSHHHHHHHHQKDHVVHVPQTWALIINKHTIITCAPLDTSTLRGETIKLVYYAEALKDEATWSVHFTDAQGTVFYIPLRFCKTWFGLVKQIAEDCLHDEYDLIRDQLLKNGPLYQLVTEEDVPVNAESWSHMMEDERTEVIRLRLKNNEGISNRLLVTYCDEDGNEMSYESQPSSDSSSLFSEDEGESDATESSATALPAFDGVDSAVKRLRGLHEKLAQAKAQGNAKRIEDLQDRKIPALEQQILKLTAESLDLDPARSYAKKKARVAIPEVNENRRGSSGRLYGNSTHTAAGVPKLRLRPRSRSRSQPRPRLSRGVPLYTPSTYDLSLDGSRPSERPKRPSLTYSRSHSFSQPRHIFGDYSFPPRTGNTSSRQSYAKTGPSRLVLPPRPPDSRSHWDTVRSRVLNGQGFSAFATPISPKTSKDDIYYKPSNKQLARSRWEFLRARILAGGDLGQTNGENDGTDSQDEPSSPRVREKLASAMKNMLGDKDAPPIRRASDVAKPVDVTNGSAQEVLVKTVNFAEQSQEPKPKLKRLITLAHKELSKSESPSSAIVQSPSATKIKSSMVNNKAHDLPIFLWSTVHIPHDAGDLSAVPKATSVSHLQGEHRSLSETAITETTQSTSKVEELILRTVMNEMHANLRKPKKVSPEYAELYEEMVEKDIAEVTSLMTSMDSDDGRSNDKPNGFTPLSNPRGNLAGSATSAETLKRLRYARHEFFEVARQILNAFVPEGYETSIVSKYWGAIYQIIQHKERDEAIMAVVTTRLLELFDLVQSIQMGVRTEDGSKQARYQIPRALPAAFQHLVMLLVVASMVSEWTDHSWNLMQQTFDECEGLFIEGRKQLILMIHTDDYREAAGFQAVDAEALLSLILANLVSHLSSEREFHLTEIYSEYTTMMHSMVRDQASVKVYDDIKLLREEIDVIKNTLKQQDETLHDFRSTISMTYGVPNLGLSVIDRMLESIEQRIDDFNELQGQAETARFLAAQSISLKAESNNKAIIVFTVVTIVFLPLSFVTSYLGMNTSDIRSMQSSQTLFWAIGAPVAFVVLGAAIFAAFYGTLTQRVTGRAWRGKEKPE